MKSQAGFVFGQNDETERPSRPVKRRKLTKKAAPSVDAKHAARSHYGADFMPLLNGLEKPEFVSLRQKLFVDAWSAIDARIQVRLPPSPPKEKIPKTTLTMMLKSERTMILTPSQPPSLLERP